MDGPLIPLVISLVTVVEFCFGQEALAKNSMAQATVAIESRQFEAAGGHLLKALQAANKLADKARSSELSAEIGSLNEGVDKTLEQAFELNLKSGERLAAIMREFIDAGLPTSSKLIARQLSIFDSELAESLTKAAEAAAKGRDKKARKVDSGLSILLTMQDLMDPSDRVAQQLATFVDQFPAIGKWRDLRRELAAKHQALARDYAKRKWTLTAWDLLSRSRRLDRGKLDNKLYQKLSTKSQKLLITKREKESAPSMKAFIRGHEKFGRSKKWKISGKLWRSPKPGKHKAIVLSKQRLFNDYSIQIESRLPGIKTSCEVIVAARGPEDYLAVVFERTRGSLGTAVLTHVKDGVPKRIVGTQAQGVLSSFAVLRATVTGEELSVQFLKKMSCKLPFPLDDGLRFGFGILPCTKAKITKSDAAEFRHLTVAKS